MEKERERERQAGARKRKTDKQTDKQKNKTCRHRQPDRDRESHRDNQRQRRSQPEKETKKEAKTKPGQEIFTTDTATERQRHINTGRKGLELVKCLILDKPSCLWPIQRLSSRLWEVLKPITKTDTPTE